MLKSKNILNSNVNDKNKVLMNKKLTWKKEKETGVAQTM